MSKATSFSPAFPPPTQEWMAVASQMEEMQSGDRRALLLALRRERERRSIELLRALTARFDPAEWQGRALEALSEDALFAYDLSTFFSREGLSWNARRTIVDALVASGTPPSQTALRRILSAPLLRHEDRRRAAFLRRLGLIARPEPATIAFLLSIEAGALGRMRVAATWALALCARALDAHGLSTLLSRVVHHLDHRLLASEARWERSLYLAALALTGTTQALAAITHYADHAPDSAARAARFFLQRAHAS
jgi:hypothetical protein